MQELNHNFKSRSIVLELIKWETHTHPSFGIDPQDVINTQINDSYDIFIGIMWAKFGTPTNRSGSGTEEEFNRAYQLHLGDPNSIKIMFYFNTKPVPFDLIDPEQIQKIKNFKGQLGELGGLYWEYSDLSEIERYLRMHISSVIEELESVIPTNIAVYETIKEGDEEEELGLFDYLEVTEDSFQSLLGVMENMTEIITDIGNQMTDRATEITSYSSANNMNNKTTVRYIDRAARDLDNFVQRMDIEIPIFKDALSQGLDAFINAMNHHRDWQGDNEEFHQTSGELKELGETMSEACNQIVLFKNEIIQLPNLNKKFNKAKKDSLKVLNRIIREMDLGSNQINQFELTALGT